MTIPPIPAARLFLCALACHVFRWCGCAGADHSPDLGTGAAALYALRSVGLDPQQVFKIREAVIEREDVHIWLNDGLIAFTQAVDGRVTGAYFEGEARCWCVLRPHGTRFAWSFH